MFCDRWLLLNTFVLLGILRQHGVVIVLLAPLSVVML